MIVLTSWELNFWENWGDGYLVLEERLGRTISGHEVAVKKEAYKDRQGLEQTDEKIGCAAVRREKKKKRSRSKR